MSKLKDKNLISEYILYSIEETLEHRPHYLISALNTRLSKNSNDSVIVALKQLKTEIDAQIRDAIDQQDLTKLKNPAARQKLTDEIFNNLDKEKREKFNQDLKDNLEEMQKGEIANVDTNLILSEVFMGNTEINNNDFNESKINTGATDTMTNINISKFENELIDFDFSKYNSHKLMAFFDMINKYDFSVDFKNEDRTTFEGFLLVLIYNNTRSINSFVFKQSFRKFAKNFTNKFLTDFEVSIDTCDFIKASHLVLLCSYNPALCVYLDKKGFIEQLIENFDRINLKDIHIYLKAFINIFTNYSYVIDKAVALGVCDKLAAKLLQSADIETVSLFLTLLNKLSEFNVTPNKLFERAQRKLIVEKILAIYVEVNEIKILSYKIKNKPNTFTPENVDDPVLLLNQYCHTYKEMITQKSTVLKYQRLYYFSVLVLKCLTKNFDLIDKKQTRTFVELAFDIVNVFFYQKDIVRYGFKALGKLASKEDINVYIEEIFTTEILKNTFTVFERSALNDKSIEGMLAFQAFIINFLDCLQMANLKLSTRNLKELIDTVYKIKYSAGMFYYDLKKKYLAKGLVKYIDKIKNEFKYTFVKQLDIILSQNALILQKLSHTHSLESNIDIILAPLKSSTIWDKSLKDSNYEKPSTSFYVASKVIYIVSKVDRKEDYLDKVITFNLNMLDKIEDFVDQVSKLCYQMPFDMVESMIEYLIVNIYFIKTYDEQYKKLTSIKALKKTVMLLTHLFVKAKSFTDLSSNHQIYILLENLSMFWFLFFDYKYKFYDRLSFIFIDNLKELPREKHDNKEESFTNAILHSIINFLNDFADLKSKCIYINFVIIKQLDVINNTLTNISTINKNFIINIIQKALSLNYSTDIHKLHPKYIVNYSVRLISTIEVREHLMNFIYRHKLYLNPFVYHMLRNSLSKNYDFNDIEDDGTPGKEIVRALVQKRPLSEDPTVTRYLFNMAQQNVKHKSLFQDIMAIIKSHLRAVSSEYHATLVKQLLNNNSMFSKLVRLYKKDRVNLSKMLKYFLLISKHYNLYKEINIPDNLISTMLSAKDLHKFEDIYIHLINYIIENDKYATFKTEIDAFFVNIKKYLDGHLFFNNNINFNEQIKSIYYFLKVLRNCSTLAPQTLNINIEEFIIKFILQLFDENNKMELVPVNNLHMHFNQYFLGDQHNYKNIKYERKIIVILFNLIKVDFPIQNLLHDSFVVNKLISFSYYVLEDFPLEVYQNIYMELLNAGVSPKNTDVLFKDMFYDFYFLLYYTYGVEIDEVAPWVHEYISNGPSVGATVKRLLESLKRKIVRFDSLNYNLLIRDMLVLYYIVNDAFKPLNDDDYLDILSTLDHLYKSYYKDIKKVSKVEQLFVEIYIYINKVKGVKSNKSAAIFFNIFATYSEFKFASLIDKYVYMGLCNKYIQIAKTKSMTMLKKDTIEFYKSSDEKIEKRKKLEKIKTTKGKLEEVLKQLSLEGLNNGNELVLLKFIRNCYLLHKEDVTGLTYDYSMIERKLKAVIESINSFSTLSHVELLLLKRRLDLFSFAFTVYFANNDERNDNLIDLIKQTALAFETLNKNNPNNPNIKPKLHLQLVRRQAVTFKRFYYYVSSKNETTIKPQLLNWLSTFIPKLTPKNIEEPNTLVKANQSLYLGIKILNRKYDEVRICQHPELVSKLLGLFKADIIDKVPEVTITKRNPYEEIDETQLIYPFTKNNNIQSLSELSLYIFTAFSKNRLLLDINFKSDIFNIIDANSLRFRHTELMRFILSKLTSEYKESGMSYTIESKDDETATVPTSLASKQKNILYVHKIFSTLWNNINKNNGLGPREEKYLKFGISSLKLHLMENIDPEIFNKLSIFSILCDFFVSDDIPVTYKHDLLGLMKEYLDKTSLKNSISAETTKDFLYFYEKLLFNNFVELRAPYFEVLLIILKLINFDSQFIDTYFDKLNFALFETNNEISETVFVSTLEVYALLIYKYDIKYDFAKLEEVVYTFIKLNNKNLMLQERAFFAVILSYLDMRVEVDQVKLNNMTLFLKFKHNNETLDQMYKTLLALEMITDNYDRAQTFLKTLNFELIFKVAIKKYCNSRKMVDLLCKIFLRYTYKIDENKFEMFETLKYLNSNIELFYKTGDRASVLMLYKCLINASLLKKNAEYLVNIDLNGIILKCFYKNDTEFYYLVLSLLFNICYLFDSNEINIKDLITPEILHMISLTYDDCLEKRNDAILGQIIDLFLAFIHHNNIEFFTLRLIKRMKLTLNFYYNNPAIIIKFLNIVKDLTVSDNQQVQELLLVYFDPIYLYHIHFRNLKNAKINTLVKTIIFNVLRIRSDAKTESYLVTYGIPDNIVHTFSLDDEENVMIVNLNIILYSLKCDKPMAFLRSEFVCTLKTILFAEYIDYSDEVEYMCLEILHGLYEYYKDVQLIHTNLYFDNIPKLVKLISLYKDTEKYLHVLVKIVKNLIENDKDVLRDFDSTAKTMLSDILDMRNRIADKIIVDDLFYILNSLDVHTVIKDVNQEAPKQVEKYSMEDKQLLTSGIPVAVIYKDKVFKSAIVKFDFVKMKLMVHNVSYTNRNNQARKKLDISVKKIDAIDSFKDKEVENVEERFRSYLNKRVKRELFLNVRFWVEVNNDYFNEYVVMVFENEYKCRKVKSLIEHIKSG